MVTEASYKNFAEEVEKVIGKWYFARPMWEGKPISVIGAIEIEFRSQVDVISLDISLGISDVMMKYNKANSIDRIEIVEFDELDAYPELIEALNPLVSIRLIAKHRNTVGVFSFYIDTEGYVSLAHIDRIEGKIDIRLLEATQDALEQWRFSPPTRNGRKVIVAVSQPFVFSQNGSYGLGLASGQAKSRSRLKIVARITRPAFS